MNKNEEYWRANVSLVLKLLAVWFAVPFLGGIVFVDALNTISLGGYKLGFWIAQQGSIYMFVFIVFFYANRMNKLDAKFGLDEKKRGRG